MSQKPHSSITNTCRHSGTENAQTRLPTMQEYHTTIVNVADLPESTLQAMSQIYLAHYDSSSEVRFRADLIGKNEALLVYHDAKLVGFSLYEIYSTIWYGNPVRIIYSGDTIVDRVHWGQQALAFRWIGRAGQIKQQQPDIPLYWFLIVKGHRTYRYLPAFSHDFHPHWSKSNRSLSQLSAWLATERFPEHYDPRSGLIKYPHSRGHLKPAYASPTDRELSKDSVRYFLQRNPGYLVGHELVCLCELSEGNLKPLARRVFTSGSE